MFRAVRRQLPFVIVLLAICGLLALGARDAASQEALARRVWDDPEIFRFLAQRREPWPLRQYPPPTGGSDRYSRCAKPLRTQILFGPRQIPLWVSPFPTRITSGDVRAFQDWRYNQLRRGLACPEDRVFRAHYISIYAAENMPTGLDPRCFSAGLPPNPQPECDRPGISGFYATFVLGLPNLIQIAPPDRRRADSDIISGGFHVAQLQPDLEERRTRRGNTLLVSRGGEKVWGTLMPRIGDPSDTAAPLYTNCSFEWTPPEPNEPRSARQWTECIARFRFRGVLDVTYRFYREIFDEPDVPGLDLRVRDYVRALLVPPNATR